MQPKVSVIIPVYNVEKYLDACLNSVLSQTMQGIEIICVDDGSTDSSPAILDRYAARHDNLRLLRKENGGQSAARNDALRIARGEYILFVDSDDELTGADSIARMCARADETRSDLLIFSAKACYETEALRRADPAIAEYVALQNAYADGLTGPDLYIQLVMNRDDRVAIMFNLYRRAFLEAHNLRFVEGLLFEDQLFTVQCFACAERTAQLNASCYLYRVREGSTMTGMRLREHAKYAYQVAAELDAFIRALPNDIPAAFRNCCRVRVREMTRKGTDKLRCLPRSERASLLRELRSPARRVARADIARLTVHRITRRARMALRALQNRNK